jgi:hypothetical protein
MYSQALSGPYASTTDEDSTYVDGSVRRKPEALSISTASELYEGSIVMRSADSTTMHTALESPVAYSSFFLSSSVSVSKPSYAAPATFEVGISSFYEDEERLRDSMSWTRASTFDQRTHAEDDLVNVSSMDFSPTEQDHNMMIGHSPVNGKPWPDFYAIMPPMHPPSHPQAAQGAATRVGLPFPLVPLKSSPATTTPFQSPPSPQGNARRKPRSSSFFNPIRLAFPPRHPSSSPSVPARRSAPASPSPFPPLPVSSFFPIPKSAGAELSPTSPAQEHSHGRRRHRQPLRTARDWFSSRLFAAAAA